MKKTHLVFHYLNETTYTVRDVKISVDQLLSGINHKTFTYNLWDTFNTGKTINLNDVAAIEYKRGNVHIIAKNPNINCMKVSTNTSVAKVKPVRLEEIKIKKTVIIQNLPKVKVEVTKPAKVTKAKVVRK